MFNVGGGELLVIMLVALIVLGPQRLPEAARTVGKVVGEIRRLSSGFQREIRDAFEDADTTRKRPERAPLAAAVDDLDADPEVPSDPEPLGALPDEPPATNGSSPGDAGGLAPEVGDAIDHVVDATPPAGGSDDTAGDTPADVPEDGPGDARAAS